MRFLESRRAGSYYPITIPRCASQDKDVTAGSGVIQNVGEGDGAALDLVADSTRNE